MFLPRHEDDATMTGASVGRGEHFRTTVFLQRHLRFSLTVVAFVFEKRLLCARLGEKTQKFPEEMKRRPEMGGFSRKKQSWNRLYIPLDEFGEWMPRRLISKGDHKH